jgi:peroxiredoxin
VPTLLPAQLQEAISGFDETDGSLNQRLAAVAAKVREVNPGFADAIEALIARFRRGGAGAEAPKIGEPLPPFLLPDDSGALVALDELIEHGPVAVVFNRGHWCPYCRLNTLALTSIYDDVRALGANIVAITPERQAYARRLKETANAPFPLLTDMDNGYALSLGLVVWIGSDVARYNDVAGVNLPTYQGNDSWTIPIPATFVVGTDGLVKARYVDPDYRRRMATEDLLAALKSAA